MASLNRRVTGRRFSGDLVFAEVSKWVRAFPKQERCGRGFDQRFELSAISFDFDVQGVEPGTGRSSHPPYPPYGSGLLSAEDFKNVGKCALFFELLDGDSGGIPDDRCKKIWRMS